jgi:hypothetical protein
MILAYSTKVNYFKLWLEGLWSYESGTAVPEELTSARESPALAQISVLSSSIRTATAVHPLGSFKWVGSTIRNTIKIKKILKYLQTFSQIYIEC